MVRDTFCFTITHTNREKKTECLLCCVQRGLFLFGCLEFVPRYLLPPRKKTPFISNCAIFVVAVIQQLVDCRFYFTFFFALFLSLVKIDDNRKIASSTSLALLGNAHSWMFRPFPPCCGSHVKSIFFSKISRFFLHDDNSRLLYFVHEM